MAAPICPKCGNDFFSGGTIDPNGLDYSVKVVYCVRCGTIIGVLDKENVGATVNDILEKLEDMEHKINYLIK